MILQIASIQYKGTGKAILIIMEGAKTRSVLPIKFAGNIECTLPTI